MLHLLLPRFVRGVVALLLLALPTPFRWSPHLPLGLVPAEVPFVPLRKRLDPALNHGATRRACRKCALVPTVVMNFAEGTRFTPAKHAAQGSPYRHLLKPKAGALAFALDAMGEQFQSLLDVTIVYPSGRPTFWQFLCGR